MNLITAELIKNYFGAPESNEDEWELIDRVFQSRASYTVIELMDDPSISADDKMHIIFHYADIRDADLYEFACWCIEQVISIWEAERPSDITPQLGIEAVRMWLRNEVSEDEVHDVDYSPNQVAKGASRNAKAIASSVAEMLNLWGGDYAAKLATNIIDEDHFPGAEQRHLDKLREIVLNQPLTTQGA